MREGLPVGGHMRPRADDAHAELLSVTSAERSQGVDLDSNKQEGRILRIPDQVADKIVSSINITSVSDAVIGLLKNSLDAGASQVRIEVDFSRGNCEVGDNGLGIHPADFMPSGTLAIMHHTSKVDQQGAVHGCSGSFLASLSAMSILSITSQRQGHRSSNRITFSNGGVISRVTPVLGRDSTVFKSQGTIVTVRNLFGNMPVRVKHRAASHLSRSKSLKDWDMLRMEILSTLLAWHDAVDLRLIDSQTGRKVLTLCHPEVRSGTCIRVSDDIRVNVERLNLALVQSGLLMNADEPRWIPASASSRYIEIHGAISLLAAPTKSLQFISIGVKPLGSHRGHNELFDCINRLFHDSDYGSLQAGKTGKLPVQSQKGTGQPGYASKKEERTRRKNVEQWPMFHLRVSQRDAGNDLADSLLKGDSALNRVVEVLTTMVVEWLITNNLPVRRTKKLLSRAVEGLTISSPSTSATRMKGITKSTLSSRGLHSVEDDAEESNSGVSNSTQARLMLETPKFSPPSNCCHDHPRLDDDYASSVANEAEFNETRSIPDESQELWKDPFTGKKHLVDARTGMAIRNKPTNVAQSRPQSRLTFDRTADRPQTPNVPWISNLLSTWDNPVYASPEQPLHHLYRDHPPSRSRSFNQQGARAVLRDEPSYQEPSFGTDVQVLGSKISREALAAAEVISQVDNQFILIAAPALAGSSEKTRMLIAVDQHAADERCKVEHLFSELCAELDEESLDFCRTLAVRSEVNLRAFRVPIRLCLPSKEAAYLDTFSDYFAQWGIVLRAACDDPALGASTEVVVEVLSLPRVVAERCKAQPSLLIAFLRSEIWALVDGKSTAVRTGNHHDHTQTDVPQQHAWLPKLGRCPAGLVEMINSRACRSAIMFNDVLSKSECKALVGRLSRCAFPFQCAHGRPSIAPLLKLENPVLPGRSESEEVVPTANTSGTDHSFVQAYLKMQSSG